jgi:hypothetical protein
MVFTFAMLSEIIAIDWLCTNRPDTPDRNPPKILMLSSSVRRRHGAPPVLRLARGWPSRDRW